MRLFYSISLLFTITVSALMPIGAEGLAGVAVLVEGTRRVEGVPGFVANRIPALYGRYELEAEEFAKVWAIEAPLVFNPDLWVTKKNRADLIRSSTSAEGKRLVCVERKLAVREGMSEYSTINFMIEFERKPEGEFELDFANAFIEKTEFFFSSAKRFQDASFPATIMLTGN